MAGKAFFKITAVIFFVAVGTLTSVLNGLELTDATEVTYSPNFLLLCDSLSLVDNIEFLQSNGYGYQFRVAGYISEAFFGSAMAFAYGIVPEYAPRIRSTDKAGMIETYYLDEKTTLSKTGDCSHDMLLDAFTYMSDADIIATEMATVPQKAKEQLAHQLANDQQIEIEKINLTLKSTDDCPGFDPDNTPKQNWCRHFHNGMTVVYIIVNGDDPAYVWTEEMLEYSIEQSISGLNYLAYMCEDYAFPVCFYTSFNYIEIPYTPIMGIMKGE